MTDWIGVLIIQLVQISFMRNHESKIVVAWFCLNGKRARTPEHIFHFQADLKERIPYLYHAENYPVKDIVRISGIKKSLAQNWKICIWCCEDFGLNLNIFRKTTCPYVDKINLTLFL